MADIDIEKLYDLAGDQADDLAGELFDFEKFLRDHHEIKNALVNYSLEKSVRKEILDRVSANRSEIFRELIGNLLLEEELLHEFSWLTEKFVSMVEKRGNARFAELLTAFPLTDNELKLIRSKFGENIKFLITVEPELLGGILIKFADGKVLDLSLRGGLEPLRMEMIK